MEDSIRQYQDINPATRVLVWRVVVQNHVWEANAFDGGVYKLQVSGDDSQVWLFSPTAYSRRDRALVFRSTPHSERAVGAAIERAKDMAQSIERRELIVSRSGAIVDRVSARRQWERQAGPVRAGALWADAFDYWPSIAYHDLWRLLVPDMGEADTEHGEHLRIASRIYYDVYNNGGCNLHLWRDEARSLATWVRRNVSHHGNSAQAVLDLVEAFHAFENSEHGFGCDCGDEHDMPPEPLDDKEFLLHLEQLVVAVVFKVFDIVCRDTTLTDTSNGHAFADHGVEGPGDVYCDNCGLDHRVWTIVTQAVRELERANSATAERLRKLYLCEATPPGEPVAPSFVGAADDEQDHPFDGDGRL